MYQYHSRITVVLMSIWAAITRAGLVDRSTENWDWSLGIRIESPQTALHTHSPTSSRLNDELFVKEFQEKFPKNIFGKPDRLWLEPLSVWIDLDYWP